ncbi:hypothetical protein CR513_38040, partial [Mucuna pruriens]
MLFGRIELHTELRWGCRPTELSSCNLAYDQAGQERKFQLHELDELYLEAYENSRIYKMNIPTTPYRSMSIRSNYSMKALHQFRVQLRCHLGRIRIDFNPVMIKCVGETPGDEPRVVYSKRVEKEKKERSKCKKIKETRPSQSTPSRPTNSTIQQPMRKQPNSPIRSGPIASSTSMIQHRGHLSSSSTAMSILENLPRYSEEFYNSKTKKPKIVKGDRLDYQRTLVDLILSVLANGGEPSPFDHGDRRGRRIH